MYQYQEITSDNISNDIEKHFKVSAGPGAGKTYWLVRNILNVVEKSKRLVSPSKIACITYTNVAVDEIQKKLNISSDVVEVSTIHSFLYANIVKPYIFLLKNPENTCLVNYSLMDGHDDNKPSKGKIISWQRNCGILYVNNEKGLKKCLSDLNWFIIDGEYKLDTNKIYNKIVDYIDKKGIKRKITISKNQFEIYKDMVWVDGTIHHSDVLYFAHRILKENPYLAMFLVAKYPYIYIDEFQDTSPIQTEVIRILGESGCVIGVIGDPAQSIYKFTGASRKDFVDFKLENMQFFTMSQNRRSSNNIIKLLNRIRNEDESKIIQKLNECEDGEQIFFDIANTDEAYDKFQSFRQVNNLSGDFCIITPTNPIVTKLRSKVDGGNRELWDNYYDKIPDHSFVLEQLLISREYALQLRYEVAMKELSKIFKDKDNTLRKPFKAGQVALSNDIKRSYSLYILTCLISQNEEFIQRKGFSFL